MPHIEGYTFLGWDKTFYRITDSVKIQALYIEGIYTTRPVSFYGKITGNPSWQLLKTEYVPVGDDAHPPKLPVNAGYTFREWSGQITGIQTAQNVYAQYNKNTETETTYTVRFWCRGQVIKTEEVAIGGNATPPAVPGLKGYSFAGWDKSYVNINPGTRSMAVDITAQYQLTSGIQNAGSVSDLVNALMALGVPVAVKNGFSALGAAIINPFDGIILDVLAATALVGTIIYYWDDIKDLWSDIKVIFGNFAGMDAAGEILDNIEAGVDEAGKEDGDSEADKIFDAGKEALENADIDNFTIKDKHLNSSGGNWKKFNVATAEAAKELVKKILAGGTIVTITDNGIGTAGQQSFKILIDAGKVIGTKGEHLLRIIVDELGNVWTVFPE